MQIVKGLPPNIEEIKQFLPVDKNTIFCYGDIVYCQDNDELPEDLIVHEDVHKHQQAKYTSPDNWWKKYLLDKEFRFEQELEAYAQQYAWVKTMEGMTAHVLYDALTEFGEALAHPQYGLGITPIQASSKIRNLAKNLV